MLKACRLERLVTNGALCHSSQSGIFQTAFFKSITQLPATATRESKARFRCVQEAGLMWSTMEVRRWEETKAQLPPPPPASSQPVPAPAPSHSHPPHIHPPGSQRHIRTPGHTLASALLSTCSLISLLPSPLSLDDWCRLSPGAAPTLSPLPALQKGTLTETLRWLCLRSFLYLPTH